MAKRVQFRTSLDKLAALKVGRERYVTEAAAEEWLRAQPDRYRVKIVSKPGAPEVVLPGSAVSFLAVCADPNVRHCGGLLRYWRINAGRIWRLRRRGFRI